MSSLRFTARALPPRKLLAIQRPALCQMTEFRQMSTFQQESHHSTDLFDKLRKARSISMGALVHYYRENRALFSPAHHVFALMMIDVEASAASYDARSFAETAGKIRRVPEVVELAELSAQAAAELDAHLLLNLLYFLCQYRMFGVLYSILSTSHNLDKLDIEDLLLIGNEIPAEEAHEIETWPSMVTLSSYLLQRLPMTGEDDLVGQLCGLLLIVSRYRLAVSWSNFPEALALVKERAQQFPAGGVSGIARVACNLAGEQATSLLSALGETAVSTIDSASPRRLSHIVLAYGLYAPPTLGMDFWDCLLDRTAAVFVDFSPMHLIMVARGVAAAPAIDRLHKAHFLLRVAEASIKKIGKFEAHHLCSLLSIYSGAKCIHKELFSQVSDAVLRLLPLCKSSLLVDIMHHLAWLKYKNSLLLTEAADKIVQGIKGVSSEQLARVAFTFAAAGHKDASMLSVLAEEVQLRWKVIPMEEFKEICRCLDSLGFESKDFENHKFFRFGDAEKPLQKALKEEIRADRKPKKKLKKQRIGLSTRKKRTDVSVVSKLKKANPNSNVKQTKHTTQKKSTHSSQAKTASSEQALRTSNKSDTPSQKTTKASKGQAKHSRASVKSGTPSQRMTKASKGRTMMSKTSNKSGTPSQKTTKASKENTRNSRTSVKSDAPPQKTTKASRGNTKKLRTSIKSGTSQKTTEAKGQTKKSGLK